MRTFSFAVLMTLTLAPAAAFAQRNVELEIVTEPGLSITAPQKWITALADLGLGNLRIRAAKAGDRAQIEETGTAKSPAFMVTGILTANGKLIVPGGSFSMDQKAQLKAWLQKLASGKKDEPKEEVGAFGLTPEQLVATHEALAGKLTFETKGKAVGEIARSIVKEIELKVSITPDARKALEANEVVLDELNGLSLGTSLAAALRPAGLVFAPVRVSKNEVQIEIADSRSLEQAWPVGWPMEKGLSETLPNMSKFLNVEINNVVLGDALNSIQGRVQAPFLYDHNGLARQRVDLTKAKVSLPDKKTYYKKILDGLLAQVHLQCEVRLDEASTPFVWISPVR